MAEEMVLWKMEGFKTVKGSWPWPWIGSYCIPSCITHQPLSTCQISLKSKNFLWTDRHLRPALLGRLCHKVELKCFFGVNDNSAIRRSAYEVPLACHSNYVPILHSFLDTARYWSKIVSMNLCHLYLWSLLAVTLLEFHRDLRHQKTKSPWAIYRMALFVWS